MDHFILKDLEVHEHISSTDNFYLNVNTCNYSEKQINVIYGKAKKVSYLDMNRLLDKAFAINDYRVINRLIDSYE